MYFRVAFKDCNDRFHFGYESFISEQLGEKILSCVTTEEFALIRAFRTVYIPAARIISLFEDEPWVIDFGEYVSEVYNGYFNSLIRKFIDDPAFISSDSAIGYIIDKFKLPMANRTSKDLMNNYIHFVMLMRDLVWHNINYCDACLSISG